MIERDKAALRADMATRRAAAHAAAGGGEITERLLTALGAAAPVAGYLPIRTEIDPRPALFRLHDRGVALALPVVTERGAPLAFWRWAPGDPLVPGAFGVAVPTQARSVRPMAVIVPMLAFDRAGRRLGYGGGFYDRTLARLRAEGPVRAVGLAYAAQEVPAVPHGVDDQPLDLIVTERDVIEPAREAA